MKNPNRFQANVGPRLWFDVFLCFLLATLAGGYVLLCWREWIDLRHSEAIREMNSGEADANRMPELVLLLLPWWTASLIIMWSVDRVLVEEWQRRAWLLWAASCLHIATCSLLLWWWPPDTFPLVYDLLLSSLIGSVFMQFYLFGFLTNKPSRHTRFSKPFPLPQQRK